MSMCACMYNVCVSASMCVCVCVTMIVQYSQTQTAGSQVALEVPLCPNMNSQSI